MTAETTTPEPLFRVTYATSGLRRRVRTLTATRTRELEWYGRGNGMRFISKRPATDAEIERGAFTGWGLNS